MQIGGWFWDYFTHKGCGSKHVYFQRNNWYPIHRFLGLVFTEKIFIITVKSLMTSMNILITDGLKGLQVKMFVPVDVSMDSTTNIFTYYKMINLKIFGRALFELWLHWWILQRENLHLNLLQSLKIVIFIIYCYWGTFRE